MSGRINPPRQQRSQHTLDRILDAVERLLEHRPFDDLSVQDILDEADVSRSSFYARFPAKDALLTHVYERQVARTLDALRAATDLDLTAFDAPALVEQLIRAYVDFVTRFEPLLLSVDRRWTETEQGRTLDLVPRTVADLYLRVVGREGDDGLARHVEFATHAIGAIILRALAPPRKFAELVGIDVETLVGETTTMAMAYLGVVTDRTDDRTDDRPPGPARHA